MFGLGFTEILLLILIAFLIFGPQQFPVVLKNFIKILNELKNAWTEVKSDIYDVQTEANKQIYQIKNKIEKEFSLIEEQEESLENKKKSKDSTKKNNSHKDSWTQKS